MKQKLINIQSNQWFRLDDRPDGESVTLVIDELINEGYKFIFSDCKTKFMRLSIDLFEWAALHPKEKEIKIRTENGKKYYDLYSNGKLIAIK